MAKISRRDFFKSAGSVAVATLAPNALAQTQAVQAPATSDAGSRTYLFFNADESPFVEAAMARFISGNAQSPGALEADAPLFLDRQLAGAWGAGARFYSHGPWRQGTPSQGYQLPFTPAEFFRRGIAAVNRWLAGQQKVFTRLAPGEQDAVLTQLEKENIDLDGIPSPVFIDNLLASTVEGFFSDPIYGGNRDMAAWRMIGFPGAYAAYYEIVDKHGIKVDRPPVSIGSASEGHIHVHPDQPLDVGNPAAKGT